jgi:hypothetical protein
MLGLRHATGTTQRVGFLGEFSIFTTKTNHLELNLES